MAQKSDAAVVAGGAGIGVAAEVKRNQVKIKIVFSGGREASVDLDSSTGCKCTMTGPMYPADMALVSAIIQLVSNAKDIYPPAT